MSEGNTHPVVLPATLYARAAEGARTAGFDSVDDYVVFLLEEVLRPLEEQEAQGQSEEDEKQVRKRLKALGYTE